MRSPPPSGEAISRMTATVDIADIERELDAEKAAKKGTVILDYEAMLAALDALLVSGVSAHWTERTD